MNRVKTPVLQAVYSFWNCLVSVGESSALPEQENKYVRFTNVVTVLTAVAVVFYIPFSLWQGHYLLAGLQGVDVVLVLWALWLNHKQYHQAARHVYMLVINFFVLINSCYIGHQSQVHDFFYISYVVPFLLFGVKDYKNIVAGVLMAVVSFNIYEQVYPLFTAFNLDAATQQSMYQINVWMKFVLFGAAIYILAYYNHMTEKELAATNEKLQAQAAELKRSNEDLEQFAYIVSHDLKAPVRNIGGFIKILLTRFKDSFSGEMTEFMTHAKDSSDRLAQQIDDLLSYCRVGRNLPPVSSVDTAQLVKTLQMELASKFAQRNAAFVCEGEFPVLHSVHSTMVYSVFQNLVQNGLKFNTNENPVVKVECRQEQERVVFSVSDNGIGIPEQHRSKLFQMFKRLHTAEQFEGTGIGLAMCKKIIAFYGGEIWLESEVNKGTTFYFTIAKQAAQQVIHPAVATSTPVLKAA